MNKNAIISVISKQSEDDNEDVIEVVTPGEFYKKDGVYYANYEETEISGMDGTTTRFEIKEDSFILMREGTTNTKMNFKKNLRELSLYSTPHGMLEIVVDTQKLLLEVDDEGGRVYIDYEMVVGGSQVLRTILEVKIKLQ